MKKPNSWYRFLSIVLCLCMVLSLMPATALAADNATAQSFTVSFAGPGSSYLEPITAEANTEIDLPCGAYQVAPNGTKVFKNFNTKEDGSGETYEDCAKYTVTGDVTLYTQWADVAVGNSFLNDGEYLDCVGNVSATEPEGSYAHYTGRTLTLHNYVYSGEGYEFYHSKEYSSNSTALIYANEAVILVLEGENELTVEGDNYGMRFETDATISGTGSLTMHGGHNSIFSFGMVTMNGGELNLFPSSNGIWTDSMIITGGRIYIDCKSANQVYAMRFNSGISFENVELLAPVGGILEDTHLVDANGRLAKTVVIDTACTNHGDANMDGVCDDCLAGCTYTVNAGSTVIDYTDFTSAVAAACAAEAAVLTLYRNVPASSYWFSSGNVTLDLNGMTYEGSINVNGSTLILTDSAEEKGTVVNYGGSAIDFFNGKLILSETVDLQGLTDDHEAICISLGYGVSNVTIGSVGEEDIVIPTSMIAIDSITKEEISVLLAQSNSVEVHQHNWIEVTCTEPKHCLTCGAVVGEPLGHSYDEGVDTAPTCTAKGGLLFTCANCGDAYLENEEPALGHNFEGSACTVCGASAEIVVNMIDSYGDGWTGNALEIYEAGVLVATATIEDGYNGTVTVPYDPTKGYTFMWVAGDYANEARFEILISGESKFTCDDCSVIANQETVYVFCNHSYGEGVETEASCTGKGGIYYTCTKCCDTYIENETPALGHNFEGSACTVCGASAEIVVNMIDSYGDGWTGNALEIYEAGVLVATATIEDGYNGAVMVPYDPTKGYTFLWVAGDYPDEASFEILISGEGKFTCDDCSVFADQETVYVFCNHSYGEGVETEASCTEKGGIYYTCPKCCDTYIENETPALGHSFGDDDICDICGAQQALSVTINMTDIEGDGWNGNGIVIACDEELFDSVTIDDGSTDTWTGAFDPNKDYTFMWMEGDYADECSFEILINDEVVLQVDDCSVLSMGNLFFSIVNGEPIVSMPQNVVYVGGAELSPGEYLDLEGNVSTNLPAGGYAYFDGTTLTLWDYTYSGTGYAVTSDGYSVGVLIYTESNDLEIEILGTNNLIYTDTENGGYGIVVGNVDISEYGALTFSGPGILNLSGEGMYAISADEITIDDGTYNIAGYAGIFTPNSDSTMTVNGGELSITTNGADWSDTLGIGHVTLNAGKVTLSAAAGVALDASTLTVNGGCLEVKKGGMEVYNGETDEPITLGKDVSVTSPEGAVFGTFINNNDLTMHTLYDADGNIADAFVIEYVDPDPVEFQVRLNNGYGVVDKITLSNPTAITGQDYITTVSASVGTGVFVNAVFVSEEEGWVGNDVFTYDESTNVLTVFGEYVTEELMVSVIPYVTLTTHLNGGSAREGYWQYTYDPDGDGVITQEWYYGEEDGFFGQYDVTNGVMVWDGNLCFVREGYTAVGYNTAADGSGTAYAMDAITTLTEDTDLYVIWQSVSPVKLESAALSFKEEIHYNIFFTLGIDENVELADMGLIMFDSLKDNGTFEDAIAIYSGAVEMDGMYMVATDGVHAKRMGDTIYFRAYAKLADGSYVYSKTVEYSAVTYAKHILDSDKPESAKALVVAMLNYGAEAQLFFNYNTDNLVNASLTEEQKALPEAYRSDMVSTVPVAPAEKQGIFANNQGFSQRKPAVSFEGAFSINYFFTPAYAPVDGITLYYWTEADFNAAEVLSIENATGFMKMDGTATSQYRCDIEDIAAKDLTQAIYVAAVYSDGTTTWTSGVLGYSIGAYCCGFATKGGAMADLAMATAVYGHHAKQYFG